MAVVALFYCVISHCWITALESRQFTTSHLAIHHIFKYLDLPFFFTNISFALQIYFLFLIEFYVNRLNNLMCHSFVGAIIKTSSFKLQQLERKTTMCSETRCLLPSRWASWGDMRPPSRDVLCCSFPIQWNVKFCSHTSSRNLAVSMCCANHVRVNQCKESSS